MKKEITFAMQKKYYVSALDYNKPRWYLTNDFCLVRNIAASTLFYTAIQQMLNCVIKEQNRD